MTRDTLLFVFFTRLDGFFDRCVFVCAFRVQLAVKRVWPCRDLRSRCHLCSAYSPHGEWPFVSRRGYRRRRNLGGLGSGGAVHEV